MFIPYSFKDAVGGTVRKLVADSLAAVQKLNSNYHISGK